MILRRKRGSTDMKGLPPCFSLSFQLEAAPAFVHCFALFRVVLFCCYNKEMASSSAPWKGKAYVTMGRDTWEAEACIPPSTHSQTVLLKWGLNGATADLAKRRKWSQQDGVQCKENLLSRTSVYTSKPSRACGNWWYRLMKAEKPFKAGQAHPETLFSLTLWGLSTISYLCRDTDIDGPQTRISHESSGMKHSGSMVYG